MVSPIRMSLFEQECAMALLEVRHLALLLLGLNPRLSGLSLPDEQRRFYRVLHDMISRTIKNCVLASSPANKRLYPADEMFALGYPLIDDILTPQPVKERCHQAIIRLARQNSGRKYLKTIGGQQLLDMADPVLRSQRGMHNRDKARENTARLCWLLVQLLIAETNGRYGTAGRPSSDKIFQQLVAFALTNGISTEGISRTTFYETLRFGRKNDVPEP